MMQTVLAPEELLELCPVNDGLEGMTLPAHESRSFGGHTLAHALVAASSLVGYNRAPDSLSAIFVSPGDSTRPITYHAELIKQGRSIDSISIRANQDNRTILAGTTTFLGREPSTRFGIQAPDVVRPEKLQDDAPVAPPGGRAVRAPFHLRTVPQTNREPAITTWLRWRDDVTLPEVRHAAPALLTFALDFLVTRPGRIALGDHGPNAVGASLDHAMWFHERVDITDWLLVEARCLSIQNSRALCTASVFSESGALIATANQQILLRIPQTQYPT